MTTPVRVFGSQAQVDSVSPRVEVPRKRPLDHLGLMPAGAVIGIDQGGGVVGVAHPLLQGPHRHTGCRCARAERVPEVMEAVRPIQPGGFQRNVHPAADVGLGQNPASYGMREGAVRSTLGDEATIQTLVAWPAHREA
jgi:hypothetical protein